VLFRKTTLAAALALLGFAGNSILCRMALGERAIDAWSFTAVRLGGGAVVLALVARAVSGRAVTLTGASLLSGMALFAYAAAFSLAYLHLSAGVGALVLFASVQVAMIGWGIRRGERLGALEWLGMALALGGLGVLAARGDANADPVGLALMAVAGVAWGAYSIRGRSSRAPLLTTAGNFAWSVPLALAGLLVGRGDLHLSARGVWLALASGALASGLGYSLWYLALPAMSAKRAALVQLLVPVIAAAAGVVLLREHVTARLAIAAAMILCGVGLAILRRGSKPAQEPRSPVPGNR
jgi:drug/metabolite transporter (DMT)-like permease